MNKFIFIIIISLSLNSFGAENSLLTLKQQLDRLQREVSDLSQNLFSDPSNSKSQKSNDIADAGTFSRWNTGLNDSVTPSKLSKAGINSKKSVEKISQII